MLYAAYYGIDWKQALTHFSFNHCDIIALKAHKIPYETSILLR